MLTRIAVTNLNDHEINYISMKMNSVLLPKISSNIASGDYRHLVGTLDDAINLKAANPLTLKQTNWIYQFKIKK